MARSNGPSRGATFDGSRGFQPTERGTGRWKSRGATTDLLPALAQVVNRRSATLDPGADHFRGLKPTATIMRSLCD